jgi:hypothetical protein
MLAESWTDGVVSTLRVPLGLQWHEPGTMGAGRHTECAYYVVIPRLCAQDEPRPPRSRLVLLHASDHFTLTSSTSKMRVELAGMRPLPISRLP